MSKLIIAVLSGLFLVSTAFAQAPAASDSSNCAAKAISKSGKPLAGAAKTAFMKKCEGDAKGGAAMASGSGCAAKAMGKNGKPLAGAAKTAFMKKCEADNGGK